MGSIFFKSGSDKLGKQEKGFWDLEAKDIDGNLVKFSSLKGQSKAFVIVNVACKCGLTSDHYKQLVDLYKEYSSQGLTILGFPCNQFMGQEPKPEPEIKAFVLKEYGVTFPLFWKIDVNGPNTHEVYRFLRQNSSLYNPKDGSVKEIPWNFGKFVVDAQGNVREFFPPDRKPNEMVPLLKELLSK